MPRIFEIYERTGVFGQNLVVISRVTGEVFFLEITNPRAPWFREFFKMIRHIFEVRNWVKDGLVWFVGDTVHYA